MSTLVFLHGWGMTPSVWHPLINRLHAHESLAPALEYPAGSLQDWAASFVEQLPLDCTLIGWSLGGMLAMQLAALYPERFRSLVLIASTPCFVAHPGWTCGLAPETVHAFRRGFERNPGRTLDRFIALQVMGDKAHHTTALQLRASVADLAAKASSLAHGLRLLEESDLRGLSLAATQSVLLLHGDADALMPLAAHRWLSRHWSGSQSCVLPETGHAPFLSKPELVASRIETFLAERRTENV